VTNKTNKIITFLNKCPGLGPFKKYLSLNTFPSIKDTSKIATFNMYHYMLLVIKWKVVRRDVSSNVLLSILSGNKKIIIHFYQIIFS
jgi:hypothetical protein